MASPFLMSILKIARRCALTAIALNVASCGEAREQKARCTAAIRQAQTSLKGKELEKALAVEDLAEARKDIDVARGLCPDKQQYLVDRLEKTLATRTRVQGELAERRADEAERVRLEPLLGFVAFVAKHRDAAERAAQEPSCHARAHGMFGFCEASTQERGTSYTVRFWKDSPKIFRFSTRVDTKARCDDLGLNREVRSWKSPAGERRSHCEIYGGVLEGLWVLVTVGDDHQTDVQVFSREYLAQDSELRKVVEREGR